MQTTDRNGNPECRYVTQVVQPSCTPQYLCGSGGNLYYEDASCNIGSSPVQTCSYGCSWRYLLSTVCPSDRHLQSQTIARFLGDS